jgi:hypothetical protein
MQFNRDEFLLLSRGGRVPSARSKGLPPEPPPAPERGRVNLRRPGRRRSLLDSLLVAAAMTRAAAASAQGQRRNR